jgi:ribosomal-protein-alanine N-acetyltransferase
MTNSMTTTVRPAVPNDLGQIHDLEQACSRNPWSRDGMANSLSNPDSVFWVLQDPKKRIIAFACSSLILDELHILEVAVDLNHRNKGFGAVLINQLLASAAARNAKRAYLEVRRSNFSAIRLYEKCGFETDAVRKSYYGDGEDAALMSREISG